MPLISGGLYSTARGRATAQRLASLSHEKIAWSEASINDERQGMLIIAGLQPLESHVEQVHVLSDNQSLFAGRLFTKDKQSETVDTIPIETIKSTQGKILGDYYWGRYLLVSFDLKNRSVQLYRDPQGLSTIFYIRDGQDIFFSTEIELLYDALENKPELNWKYLVSFVVNAHNIATVAPFEGMHEAIHGCVTQVFQDGKTIITDFWDPTAIKTSNITNEQAFQEEIYQTFASSTAALARGADRVIVELSGGLDSSSVLCVLKDAIPEDKRLLGLNLMHSQVASSNEVEYAKNVADMCNVPLEVIDWKESKPFANSKLQRRYNRPSSALFDQESQSLNAVLNTMTRNDEVMCGQGGDHLFLAPPYVETVTDYLLEKGLMGINPIISQISAYHRMPYLRIVGTTLKRCSQYMLGNLGYLPLTMQTVPWMNKKFTDHIDPSIFKPYRWDKYKKLSPGKATHTFAIDQAVQYVDRGFRTPGKSVLNPLLAQPLVELALSSPTYQTFSDGYNRFHFRKAMDKHKKGNFIWRKSKGETSGVLVLNMRDSYDAISNLVVDGRLAQRGLIDRTLLQQSLNEFRHGKTDNLWPVMNLMVVERWLQAWDL